MKSTPLDLNFMKLESELRSSDIAPIPEFMELDSPRNNGLDINSNSSMVYAADSYIFVSVYSHDTTTKINQMVEEKRVNIMPYIIECLFHISVCNDDSFQIQLFDISFDGPDLLGNNKRFIIDIIYTGSSSRQLFQMSKFLLVYQSPLFSLIKAYLMMFLSLISFIFIIFWIYRTLKYMKFKNRKYKLSISILLPEQVCIIN